LTLVKICGLRDPAHALAAAKAGADFIGLVFAESRRRVSVEQARAIVCALGEPLAAAGGGGVQIEMLLQRKRPLVVGVFADAGAAAINRTADAVGLDLVQLSGDEPWSLCSRLSRPAIKTVHVRPESSAADVLGNIQGDAALVLLDTHAEGALGGTGRPFDWAVAAEVAHRFPIVLAGGLTPENVGEAVRRVRPWAVDVSTGVETDGVKDVEKICAFIAAVREVSP
jgi:phosphoribosylanthranilate isomerase